MSATSTEEGLLPRTKYAAIYREAARRIEQYGNTYSCVAVDEAAIHVGYRYEMNGWTLPTNHYRAVFGDSGYLSIEQFGNDRDLRVLALCFMAAMVEAGDA